MSDPEKTPLEEIGTKSCGKQKSREESIKFNLQHLGWM